MLSFAREITFASLVVVLLLLNGVSKESHSANAYQQPTQQHQWQSFTTIRSSLALADAVTFGIASLQLLQTVPTELLHWSALTAPLPDVYAFAVTASITVRALSCSRFDVTATAVCSSIAFSIISLVLRSMYRTKICYQHWLAMLLQGCGVLLLWWCSISTVTYSLQSNLYLIILASASGACCWWRSHIIRLHANSYRLLHIQNIAAAGVGVITQLLLDGMIGTDHGSSSNNAYDLSANTMASLCRGAAVILFTAICMQADAAMAVFAVSVATGLLLLLNVIQQQQPSFVCAAIATVFLVLAAYCQFRGDRCSSSSSGDRVMEQRAAASAVRTTPLSLALKLCLPAAALLATPVMLQHRGPWMMQQLSTAPDVPTVASATTAALFLCGIEIYIDRIEALQLNETMIIHGQGFDKLIAASSCIVNKISRNRVEKDNRNSSSSSSSNSSNNHYILLRINDIDCQLLAQTDSSLECVLVSSSSTLPEDSNIWLQLMLVTITPAASAPPQPLLHSPPLPLLLFCSSMHLHRVVGHWERHRVLLVLQFNNALYLHRAPSLLLPLYRKLFPSIVVMAAHQTDADYACDDSAAGHFDYTCLAAVTAKHPDHEGYIALHFDAALNFHHLEHRDLRHPWLMMNVDNPVLRVYPRAEIASAGHPAVIGTEADWSIWQQPQGLQALDAVHTVLEADPALRRYNRQHDACVGANSVIRSGNDVFYLPSRHAADFRVLSAVIRPTGLWAEIAYGTITAMLADSKQSDWQRLSGVNHHESVVHPAYHTHPEWEFFHRIALGTAEGQDIINSTVSRSLPCRSGNNRSDCENHNG